MSDPTHDTAPQDAVREAREKAIRGEEFVVQVNDSPAHFFTDRDKLVDALIAAVRAEERQCLNELLREERKLVRAATIRECVAVVEGMRRCVLENGAYVDLPDTQDAIDITKPPDILFKRDALAALNTLTRDPQ